MELANRVSTFIIVMGVALIGLFVLSIIAHDAQFILLLIGMILIAVAVFINVRFPMPEKPQAERFRLLKKKSPKSSEPISTPQESHPEERKNKPGKSGRRGGRDSSGR
jgi:predicted lipid-binding transport protein (Tim44 family)